jgi:uncharacterized membrane protein (DUF106 family)
MKKLLSVLLLAVTTVGFFSAYALAKNTYTQPTNVRKAEKKQQKAQKKYAKAQKKAERKMLKTSKKNTHYPPQVF